MKMPSRSNQPKKRKTRKRAVLQFRIPQAEYRELAKAATQRDLTISEEAARRLRQYESKLKLDQATNELTAALEEDLTEAQLRERRVRAAARDLERLGYRKMEGRDLWLGPNEQVPLFALSPELEDLLTKAAKLGAELAIKESNK
jgi:uncharacterized membrane-anchored protein YjiN (DUF445 family)